MAIESKNLLVWVKAMSRGQALPLDASEIYESYAAAEAYAATATAYAGQTIKAKLEDGKYHSYNLQPSEAGYILEEIGAVSASDLKQYVKVVEALPEAGQEQGILYINSSDFSGSIWTGEAWKPVFWDVSDELDEKAPIRNPVFSGTVKVNEDEVALKSYVERLFANLEEGTTPGIVDSSNPIPENYQAGKSYRVAESGTYAGAECEVGDLILVVKDYDAETASDADFMVLQSNIDGAVTSASDATTVGEIVVFDAVTGKVIKGSGVAIASLNDAISKAHEHKNKNQLDTYDKTQAELLTSAKTEAQELVEALAVTVREKADANNVYTKAEIDAYQEAINNNLNSKISGSEVDAKIAAAKEDTLEEAAAAASAAFEERIGNIPADTTIERYIDNAVGSGGTASASAIATAKQEAIDAAELYTDTQIAIALSVVEF